VAISTARGAELLTHPLIRKIGFTGSTDAGKGIMRPSSCSTTPTSRRL
jgi:acyl-CoA reductase-like NAD-dependent aldehyde dehydrogenase